MELTQLNAISPIDGRYRNKVSELAPYCSEWALMKYRTIVEIEYFIALTPKVGIQLPDQDITALREIVRSFSESDGERIKEIESVTNHDVKAIEYFIKEQIDKAIPGLIPHKEYIHFGLTSQDINNTATPMMLQDALKNSLIPAYRNILDQLINFANEWKNVPMLARTHGQPASPTLLGKEFLVFAERMKKQLSELESCTFYGKFGGATGNFNAHYVAFPDIDWHTFADKFLVESLGLNRSFPTTQIEHYDGLGQIFDTLKRLNVILTDLCIDCWLYISSEYFLQKVVANEVGSSAMPHKVNPIDFENAEGNFGIANALFEFLSRKLPVSRLQRDLTDSTILRNIGVGVGHSLLAAKSVLKGLGKLKLNQEKIDEDLENNWAVVAEAIQTILRRENYPNPYEALKAFTRGKAKLDKAMMQEFIDTLDVSEAIKDELRKISPRNFTGDSIVQTL